MANKTNANAKMTISNGTIAVTFAEKRGDNLANYEMYTNNIKVLEEVGRVATLKIVEAIARVNVQQLWKLGNSEKTGLPYGSINEWAITEFGYSKSHVSEMLTVAKQCCDPETGAPLNELAGFSYTQLLAFTKNPKLLLQMKAGDGVEGITLKSTAKEIKNFGVKTIEDKGKEEEKEDNKGGEKDEKSETKAETSDNSNNGKGDEKTNETPHSSRTLTIEMSVFEEWYNKLATGSISDNQLRAAVGEIMAEWDKIMGNPFTE